jgi:hypothetical protein
MIPNDQISLLECAVFVRTYSGGEYKYVWPLDSTRDYNLATVLDIPKS